MIEVPLFEEPFNTQTTYAWPSMKQSLQLSTSFYQTAHTLIERNFNERGLTTLQSHLTILGVDLISFYLPPGSAWMHEEWHRAVMTHRNIGSQNDVYKLRLFRGTIAVSHVQDEDLIRLKKDFPADQVRLSEAGMEAETSQSLLIEKNHFFDRAPSWDTGLLWAEAFSVWGYINTCNSSTSTRATFDLNSDDGTDVSARDFTGLDCLGWVYDLYRPDEPYAARGVHPSGLGINRYRTLDDLTDEEKSFLKKQEWLNALNLIDPFLLGYEQFYSQWGGEPVTWNFRMQHYATSFGYDLDAVFFLKHRERNYLFKLQNYFNPKKYFPGFSLELYKWPAFGKFLLSPALAVWQQPVDQRFDDTVAATGGAFDLTAYYQWSDGVQPYLYAGVKDRGWKAGDVELGRGFLIGTGLAVVF